MPSIKSGIANDSTTTYQIPTLAIQPHGLLFSDPIYGTPMRRLSAATYGKQGNITAQHPNGDSGGLHTEYTQLNPTNADDTLLLLRTESGVGSSGARGFGGYIAPTNDYSALRHTINGNAGQPSSAYTLCWRWDPVQPKRLWFFQKLDSLIVNGTAGANVVTLASGSNPTTGYAVGDIIYCAGFGANNWQGNPGHTKARIRSIVGSTITLEDPVTAALITLVQSGSSIRTVRTTRLMRYDLDTSTNPYGATVTLVRDFTEYPVIPASTDLWDASDNNGANYEEISEDGRFVAIYAMLDFSLRGYDETSATSLNQTNAPRNHVIFAYDLVNDVSYPPCAVPQMAAAMPQTAGGTAPAILSPYGRRDCVDAIDWCAAVTSPLGNYVIVQHSARNSLGGGSGSTDMRGTGMVAYVLETGAYAGKIQATTGHGDIYKDPSTGQLWAICDWASNLYYGGPYITASRIPDATVWKTGSTTFGPNDVDLNQMVTSGRVFRMYHHGGNGNRGSNTHTTARAKSLDHVYVENYGGTSPIPLNEIIRVYLDSRMGNSGFGISDAPHFDRVCHHRASLTNFATGVPEYYRRAHPATSRDGKRLYFGSDWGDNARPMDMYEMRVDPFGVGQIPLKTLVKTPLPTSLIATGMPSGWNHCWRNNSSWISVAAVESKNALTAGLVTSNGNSNRSGQTFNQDYVGQTFFPYLSTNYANEWAQYLIGLNRWSVPLLSEINTQYGARNQDTASGDFLAPNAGGPRPCRPVRSAVNNNTTITFNVAVGFSTMSAVDWPNGSAVRFYQGDSTTLIGTRNIVSLNTSTGTMVVDAPITLSQWDWAYPAGDPNAPPFQTWHSPTRNFPGHPYESGCADRVRGIVYTGPTNQPTGYWNHIYGFDPNNPTTLKQVYKGFGHDRAPYGGVPGPGFTPYCFAHTSMVHNSKRDYLFLSSSNLGVPAGTSNQKWIVQLDSVTGLPTTIRQVPNYSTMGNTPGVAMVYDSKRDVIWFYSKGVDPTFDVDDRQLWKFDCATEIWTGPIAYTGTAPHGRGEAGCDYDPIADCMCIVGGRTREIGQNGSPVDDIYALHLDTLTWEQITIGTTTPPGSSVAWGDVWGTVSSKGACYNREYNVWMTIGNATTNLPSGAQQVFMFRLAEDPTVAPPPPDPNPTPVFGTATPLQPFCMMP